MAMSEKDFKDLAEAMEIVNGQVPDIVVLNDKGKLIREPPGKSLRELLEEHGK